MGRIEGFEALADSRGGAFFEHSDHKFAVAQRGHAEARLLELGFTYLAYPMGAPGLLKHRKTGKKFTLETILLDLEFCEFTEDAKTKALAERRRQLEELRGQLDKN